jgi:hypothetical protein
MTRKKIRSVVLDHHVDRLAQRKAQQVGISTSGYIAEALKLFNHLDDGLIREVRRLATGINEPPELVFCKLAATKLREVEEQRKGLPPLITDVLAATTQPTSTAA